MDGKCKGEPSILPPWKRESEGNFLEVQTFEQGIKNEKMKGSRAF